MFCYPVMLTRLSTVLVIAKLGSIVRRNTWSTGGADRTLWVSFFDSSERAAHYRVSFQIEAKVNKKST